MHSGGGLRRDLWVGWKPNGIGEQKPHHYRGMAKTVWENRRNLPWAWRILRKGVCDGCALGVAGFHDWTITGVHLCTTRLDLLQVNTAAAIDDDALADVAALAAPQRSRAARAGPARAPDGAARGRARVHAGLVGRRARPRSPIAIRATTPDRVGIYLTARGITNEVYYVAQKAARAIGTNNVDNAARGLPRAVDDRAEGGDRRRRDDVLVPRRDRQRPRSCCSAPTSPTASPCS